MCVEGWFRSFQLILQEPHGRQVSPFGHLQVESPFVAVRTAMIEWSKLQPRSGSDTQTAWRKPFLCEDLSLPSQSAERHEPVDTMGNAEFKESRPVLVGNTGSGKSSSGNTILGKFLAKLSGSSVTRECQSDSTDRSFDDDQKRMRNYTVVDMPGFGDTRLTEEEILCEDMYLPSQSAERHEPVDTMGNAEFKESRQVLVGNTGSGKSSSGNTILGQKFLAKLSGSSVTRECQSDSTDRSFDDDQKRMRNYTVVDMPGFGDTRLTEEEILCEDMYLPSQSAERHEPVDTMGNAEFKESRQVLVGNTGSGKSSSGNTILGQKFLAKLSGSSVTRECQSDSTDRSFDDDQKRMRNYTVVDMPGFGDTRLTEEEILCEDMYLPSQSAERHQAVDMMGIAELEEIRLVLVGNTGSGKSSSANTILGQEKFLAESSGSSVTRKCQSGSTDRAFDDEQKRMRKITVVDISGFGDTHLTEEEIYTEMTQCLYLTAPGPHAFLLVVPIGPYTDYEAQAVNHLAQIFGDDAVKSHTIVLFTKGDSLKGMEFDEYLEGSPDGLRELIVKCGGRYHVFNNEENYGNATQVQELMMKVDKMVKKSGKEFYTNAIFEEAEAAIREEQKSQQKMELETVRQSKLQQRKDQKSEHKGFNGALKKRMQKLAPSSKLMGILKRIVAAGAVGVAIGVVFGIGVAGAVGIGAAAGGVIGGGIGVIAGFKAKSVKEGAWDALVQVSKVGGVALAASAVVRALRNVVHEGQGAVLGCKLQPRSGSDTQTAWRKPFLFEDLSLPSQSAERHQPVDMMGIAELEEIRLVLVGNTGSGKSSSANTILGQKKFLAKLSGSSVTRKCQSGSTDRAFDDEQKRMRKITVVDIPGFGDTHLTEEEIHTEMAKCLYLTAPGPHAFLLVVPIGRYTDYEAQAVNHLAKIFGDDAVKSHTIVLFTKGDSLEGMEFDEYLEESPDGLRELIDKCGGRYHVFNNKENYGNATQVQELMMKVDKMGKKSETEFYTNAMFKEAEAAIRKEQKRKQEMELETDNEESKPVSQSIRKRKLPQRQDQKSERKGCNGASTQKVAPSSKLMANLKRIVAAGAVGLAIGVAFGVAVPLTAALSAHLAGSAVGLVAAQLTGASAAGAVSAVVAAASGKTALVIGAAAGGLIGAGIGVIAGSEAESVKEGALDSLVQVSSVGGVALAASVVVGASLGTAAALSAGTGAAAANSGLAPLAAQNGPTSGGTLVAGPGTTSCAATGAEGVQDTVQVAPVAAAARNTALDAVVAFGKVAAAVIPTGVVVKVVVDKTKDSQKSTYEVSFNKKVTVLRLNLFAWRSVDVPVCQPMCVEGWFRSFQLILQEPHGRQVSPFGHLQVESPFVAVRTAMIEWSKLQPRSGSDTQTAWRKPFLCEDMSLPSQSAERHQPVDMMGNAELEESRLVLVGNTGSGKSSLGNTILGQKKFLAKLSGSSVTRKCQSESTDRAFDDDQKRMRKITVVDMPGFGDTHLSMEEIYTEMAKCLYHAAPGPHAFLLVVPIGRYTDYQAQAVNHLAKIFGDDAVKSHTIVLFTKGDSLKGKEFDKYLEESPDGLRELIDKCGGRYHVFNNEENYGNATQVQELMMKVDKMVKESETEFYTNAMFEEAEAAMREEQKRKQEMESETVPQSIRKRKLQQRKD
ncbi:uncharacterized protein [Syngnathus scovelli]|uniref:uncharacterized protein n=1 Tax=Syngnathus scovelli TaxID=161590 RepID=UPI0035CC37CF